MTDLLWEGVWRSAEAGPEREALSAGGEILTYGDLVDSAARLQHVYARAGARSGDRVALLLPKSVRGVSAMLGALRSGLPYVPIDPNQPAARAARILANAGASVLVTDGAHARMLAPRAAELPSVRTVILADGTPTGDVSWLGAEVLSWTDVASFEPDAAPGRAIDDDVAYMLYTSGSTGEPKGVVISHRNALSFVRWGERTFAVRPDDRLSNHAPFHFDLSVFDLYVALHAGASVHCVPTRFEPFPQELAAWIDRERISVWYSVPSALIRLRKLGSVDRFTYRALRAVLFAGEVFPPLQLESVMAAFPRARFFNLYGPTETNVCTYCEVERPFDPAGGDISIGRAIDGVECFALTDDGRRAGPGETGELLVRGPCVMLGYWGLHERTAATLGQHPLHTQFRDVTYRTGDLVTVRDDGSYTFVGRRDHMVKTRGYRVELGEVEYHLQRAPGVAEAAVVVLPDDTVGGRLCAAVVPETPGLAVADLTAFCLESLPRYAVPEGFVEMKTLPRTSTGKVDRQALTSHLFSNWGATTP